MNDPWDVKSVRFSGQYISCMKINGVPLLPPLLSKECRKEMKYYKLLAKEVEKRVEIYKSLIPDSDSDEDKTYAPDIPEFEDLVDKFQVAIEEKSIVDSPNSKSTSSDSTTNTIEGVNISNSTKLKIDLSFNINDNRTRGLEDVTASFNAEEPYELPERDCIHPTKDKPEKQLIKENGTPASIRRQETIQNFNLNINSGLLEMNDGPSSLSSKSFTGSLIDIHTESLKDCQTLPPLIRQRSYTVLKPSPQLLAHLEVQSLSTGVDMTSISMSESLSNLSYSPNKKRRSWDLETAKVQWSTMALELKEKNCPKNVMPKNKAGREHSKQTVSPMPKTRSRSVVPDRRRSSICTKASPNSEPTKKYVSPARNISSRKLNKNITSPYSKISTKVVEPGSSNPEPISSTTSAAKPLISQSEDPATRVRELYERIQKQQMLQMANLVEKQKREQILLQQVFEEQNNLLYNQLKTVCPKSPVEIKQAWAGKDPQVEQGPVSLSQLISKKPADLTNDNSFSSTLTNTNNYISHCDDLLMKSRNITSSLKKQTPNSNQRSEENQSLPYPFSQSKSNTTKAPSPVHRPTKSSTPRRRIIYDSSSSEKDLDPILTDRTNDTMADLNVTFTTDESSPSEPSLLKENTFIRQTSQETVVLQRNADDRPISTTRTSIGPMHHSTKTNGANKRNVQCYNYQPTPKQQSAATIITAHVRGYLVRRLMRSERVQATVQTIRDALLCALQLHQDREGIRGADVDLHRRLIQQITAACYTLHDTFIASSPAERCSLIAADRSRKRALQSRLTPPPQARQPRQTRSNDQMSKSHSGAFPPRVKRHSVSANMTQSNYETFSDMRAAAISSLSRRKPWR